jgi:hypothetical protein
MPLQKLQFRPGVNRESTTLANEGGWFESDKVRFRSGYPEKIGGWVKDQGLPTEDVPPTGTFWGVCRSMWNWITLAGYNLLGLGTNLKFYIQNGSNGEFHDVTPIRSTVTGVTNAFTTDGTTTVIVNDAGHGAQNNDFVTISNVTGPVNGIPAADLEREFQITYIDNDHYSIVSPVTATSSGTPAVDADFQYQINTGSDVFSFGVGWGAGGWGGVNYGAYTGWGEAASTGVGLQLRLWSQANFGQNLILNPRGGPLYYWVVDASPNTFTRAQQLSSTNNHQQNGIYWWLTDADCPSVCNFVMVSDAQRFVLAFGVNDYGATSIDPMLVRWSDQENLAVWAPDITNQAGSYRLSRGSQIVTAIQTRQEVLVFTDAAIYSMQYLGAPYVWGFQIMGDNISILGPNTAVTVNNITYWMGVDKFYMYTGRVETLPCTLRQYIYDDINVQQGFQAFGGTNEGYNEIWWFYCSAASTTVDKYVVYNHLERTWYYGTMGRSSWLDSPLRSQPMATPYAGSNGQLVYHETGNDDGTVNPPAPITAYVQSSDFDIGDGHNFGFVWRLIPDITFDGSDVNKPQANFTVRPRQFPGTNYGTSDNPAVKSTQNYAGQQSYNVQQFTEQVYVRLRGRQMAFRVESTQLGVAWQLGTPRMDVRPDGRR